MTIAGSKIVGDAQVALQDPDGIRWTAAELVGYLNDGQLAIATVRLDSVAKKVSFVTSQGTRQTLPGNALGLVDIVRNTAGKRRAIRKTSMAVMDSVNRDWHAMPEVTEFVHFMYDLAEPNTFYVYPPSKATGGSIEMVIGQSPAQIATPTTNDASAVLGSIDLNDQWGNTLLHYILHRAWSKDAEYGGNAALAASYLSLFTAAVGAQLQSAAFVSPKF